MTLRLAELTRDNLGPVVKMPLKPGQERFVAPVVESIAEAYARWSLESLSPFFEGSDVLHRASPVRTDEVVGARAV